MSSESGRELGVSEGVCVRGHSASSDVFFKLRVQMEMVGLKLCEVLATTYRLHHSLDGCLEFRSSEWSRRVQS